MIIILISAILPSFMYIFYNYVHITLTTSSHAQVGGAERTSGRHLIIGRERRKLQIAIMCTLVPVLANSVQHLFLAEQTSKE